VPVNLALQCGLHRPALEGEFLVGQRSGLRCSSSGALDLGVRGSQVLCLPVSPRSGFLCHVLRGYYHLRLLAYQLLKSSDLLVNFCGQASHVLYLRGRQYRVALGCQAFYGVASENGSQRTLAQLPTYENRRSAFSKVMFFSHGLENRF